MSCRTIICLMFCIVAITGSSADEPEFVSMFDGESLAGWSAMPESAAADWSVVDGMIVGKGGAGRSYLTYHLHDVADFEMKLRYRFPGKGNSGVNIRARVDATGKRDFQSYHADFGHLGIGKNVLGAWDFHTPTRTEHRCFRGDRLVIDANDQPTITPIVNGLRASDIHDGEWNDVRIVARENHFQLFINGKLSSEFVEHLPPTRRLESGMIQLQVHDPGMVVHFKDLEIKVLDRQ